ncbi:MAG: Fic family protein [Alphaproteobacteria bacterium]
MIVTMRRIGEAIGDIKSLNLSVRAIAMLEQEARAVSSHASTSIEGNPLPLTDVKQLLKADPTHVRDTEREVLNYNKALRIIHAQVEAGDFRLNLATMEAIQAVVVDGLMDHPGHVGKTRLEPVLIRDPRQPENTIFIPPDYPDVRHLAKDLADFIRENDREIDPVILAGLFHRQFVIIHPFMDGNGRTARLLSTAILGQGGLDIFEVFSFENYYNRNISRYFAAFGLRGDYYEIQAAIDFSSWLEFFTDGILDELRRVRSALPDNAPPRLEAHHLRLLNYIEEHGSIRQQEYGKISNRSLAARKLDFQLLVERGYLLRCGGGRSTYYVLDDRRE